MAESKEEVKSLLKRGKRRVKKLFKIAQTVPQISFLVLSIPLNLLLLSHAPCFLYD